MKSLLKKLLIFLALFLLVIITVGFFIPQQLIIPVKGATRNDWNKTSFWHSPWGKSGVHKGIDIFAEEGREVISASPALVIYTGNREMGGNVVVALGPKWRFHYYAHLKEIKVNKGDLVSRGEVVGLVGTTGNAVGKPPHLHYTIASLFPLFWRADSSMQGSKKMFFLNPDEYLP